MAEPFLPIEHGELLMPFQSLSDAPEQNNVPFNNLLTILRDASQNNSFPSPSAMSIRLNEKRFLSDVPLSIEVNKKTDSSKGETNSPVFPAFFSDICNFFSIAGNLLMTMEKDRNQGVMIKDNREGTLSYSIESPDRNTSQKYPLLKDAQVFNATPFFASNRKQEDPLLQAAKGIMPPDDTGSLQGNNRQTHLFETLPESLPDNEILLPHEQYKHIQVMNKEDNSLIPAQINSSLQKDLTEVLFPREQYEHKWLMDKEDDPVKPVQITSSLPKELQVVSPLEANGDNQITIEFHKNQYRILREDTNNDAHSISGKLYLKVFTDTEASSPLESYAQGDQLIPSKGHAVVTDTQKYFVLKNGEQRIDTVPYATGGEGKNNTGLRDKFHMVSPKGSFPILFEETQFPFSIVSLKSPTAGGPAPVTEDPLNGEGSGDKGHNQNTSPETIIMQAEDIFPLINNQHSNENSPLRANILQNHPNADVFVLQKKGDASIEVSLEPEGMGKIDIELTLDRGLINAQINTSEIIGKEIIERNLYAILSSLIDEGLNIGSFSVSLRNRQGEMNGNNREETSKTLPAIKPVQTPFALSQNRIISIFV